MTSTDRGMAADSAVEPLTKPKASSSDIGNHGGSGSDQEPTPVDNVIFFRRIKEQSSWEYPEGIVIIVACFVMIIIILMLQ